MKNLNFVALVTPKTKITNFLFTTQLLLLQLHFRKKINRTYSGNKALEVTVLIHLTVPLSLPIICLPLAMPTLFLS